MLFYSLLLRGHIVPNQSIVSHVKTSMPMSSTNCHCDRPNQKADKPLQCSPIKLDSACRIPVCSGEERCLKKRSDVTPPLPSGSSSPKPSLALLLRLHAPLPWDDRPGAFGRRRCGVRGVGRAKVEGLGFWRRDGCRDQPCHMVTKSPPKRN